MAIYADRVGLSQTGTVVSWSEKDTLLYAVSVGASIDGQSELQFTTDNSRGVEHQVLPTFGVILTLRTASSPIRQAGDFPLSAIIHVGQSVRVPSPIPPKGEAIGTSTITGIYDAGKHAIVTTSTELRNPVTEDLIAETVSTVLIMGEGGFGGEQPPQPELNVPERAPDGIVTSQTAANQALLYRLNGDTNPLHSDPVQAFAAGFANPILHGLCTYGFSSRDLLGSVLEHEVDRFSSIEARFSQPVIPGATLETRWWHAEDAGAVVFQTVADDRIVLDVGIMRYATRAA